MKGRIIEDNYLISFIDEDGDVIGLLDFRERVMKFEGNAEEAAVLFLMRVSEMFSRRLYEEYQLGLIEGKKWQYTRSLWRRE